MRVLLTGGGSHLARALLPRLCGASTIECVSSIDIAPCAYRHPKLHEIRTDIRAVDWSPLMRDHDALIHLAFVVLRGRMSLSTMRSVNIDGTKRLFLAAREAGMPKLVHLSSASVYGWGEDRTERSPLRPLPGFGYAEQKAELEEWFDDAMPDAIRLRPHIILGPHAQGLLKSLLRQPFFVRLPDPQPLLQCVHEDDVARAILLCLEHPAAGPFNLAAADPYDFRSLARRLHPRALGIPKPVARGALELAWRLAGWGGEPAWLNGVDRTLTLDCQHARNILGWSASFTSREAIEQSLAR